MDAETYPLSDKQLIATIKNYCLHKGDHNLVKLIELGSVSLSEFNSDNWNGGTYYFQLEISLPIQYYTELNEQEIEMCEKKIEKYLEQIDKPNTHHFVSSVKISLESTSEEETKRSDVESLDVTDTEQYKLSVFVSHLSSDKVYANAIKKALGYYGVNSFVAHEDIKPSKPWLEEIKKSLNRSDALVALISRGFASSDWCDQEVGWALGRGIDVIPVSLKVQPHGFAGMIQSISADMDNPRKTVKALIEALRGSENANTQIKFNSSIALALCQSGSFAQSGELASRLVEGVAIPKVIKRKLREACEKNGQVKDAWLPKGESGLVVGKIQKLVG